MENQNLIVSLKKTLSDSGVLNCGVPQASSLGPILFLLNVNDMKSAVTGCDLRLYVNDTCLLFSNENVSSIEKQLIVDFNSLGEWFIDKTICMKLHLFYSKLSDTTTF